MKMITKQFIIENILPVFEEKAYPHEILLLKKLVLESDDVSIEEELCQFQNEDGGFFQLESDITGPFSSVAATNIATSLFEWFQPSETLIRQVVNYFESAYLDDQNGWEIVPKEVDDYPHAVWWNYDGIDGFTYGNPNPEVIGFLYKHRRYVNELKIEWLVEYVMTYLELDFLDEISDHNLYSLLRMYEAVPEYRERMYPYLSQAIKKAMVIDTSLWGEYNCQPIDVLNTPDSDFIRGYEPIVSKNLDELIRLLEENHCIQPNWKWFRDEEYEVHKEHWVGYLTLKALHILFNYDRVSDII